jgi:transposase
MNTSLCFVGVDISKAQLDVAVLPQAENLSVANDETGVAALVKRLKALRPTLIVLAATGGWEAPLTAASALAKLPVVVVNPRQVRDFAKATGALAKTDRIDAKVLARFGEAVRPAVRAGPSTPTHRDVDRREKSLDVSAKADSQRHQGPYHLADNAPQRRQSRFRQNDPYDSPVAGHRSPTAKCARGWKITILRLKRFEPR